MFDYGPIKENVILGLLIFYITMRVYSAPPPVHQKNISEAITSACSQITFEPKFLNETLFQNCGVADDWANSSQGTGIKFRCHLYYVGFTSYCSGHEGPHIDTNVPSMIQHNDTYFSLASVCEQNQECERFCVDETGEIFPLCRMAHYFKTKAKVEVKAPVVIAAKTKIEPKQRLVMNKNQVVDQTSAKPVVNTFTVVDNNNNKTNLQEISTDHNAETKPDRVVAHKSGSENPPSAIASKSNSYSSSTTTTIAKKVAPEQLPPTAVEHPPQNNELEVENPQVDDDNSNEETNTNPAENLQPINKNINRENMDDDNEEQKIKLDNKDANDEVPEVPKQKVSKPTTKIEKNSDKNSITVASSEDEMEGDSYFFSYFMVICMLCIIGYVGYHNKQKILALVLEGRRGRRHYRSRRPNSANYHKLDTNLEEAISSSCSKNSSNVIY